MIALLAKVLAAIGAIATLLTLLYKTYWSPRAKRRNEAIKKAVEVIDDVNGDPLERKKKLLDLIDEVNR